MRRSQDSCADTPRKVSATPASWATWVASCRASRPCRSQKSKDPRSTITDDALSGSISMSWVRSCSAVSRAASPTTTRTCCSATFNAMTISSDGHERAMSAAAVSAEVTIRRAGCAMAARDAHGMCGVAGGPEQQHGSHTAHSGPSPISSQSATLLRRVSASISAVGRWRRSAGLRTDRHAQVWPVVRIRA